MKRAWIASFTFEGYTHSEIFWRWLENCFKGALKGAPTLILDNASFHQQKQVMESFQKQQIECWFLPPYSPDLNPIELQWAILKKKIRRKKKTMEVEKAIQTSFQEMGQPKRI